MDVLEKYLHNIAYKFPKGYPDMNDPNDVELLNSLINEITQIPQPQIITEGDEEAIYDGVIRKALDLKDDEPIPQSKGSYKLSNDTFDFNVSPSDKPTFNKLYNTAPPKKGQTEGESKGVGNGEVALYWLYNYNPNNISVTVGRSGDDPDLFFNGNVGVEVKAYGSHKGRIQLGRFGGDKDNLALLSVIFGIRALNKVLGGGTEGPAINPTNFKGKDLIPTFEKVLELEKIEDLSSLAEKYQVFKVLQDNLTQINKALDDPEDATEAAKKMALRMLKYKLGRKPADGGYLANVLENGNIKFFKIDFQKLMETESLLDDFSVSQSTIKVNFDKMFG